MNDRLEKLIRIIYENWKRDLVPASGEHLDEQMIACLVEGRTDTDEETAAQTHLLHCQECMEAVLVNLSAGDIGSLDVAPEILERVKAMPKLEDRSLLLEIALRAKEKALELLSATGDVLCGQELLPASVLRSRKVGELTGPITVLKDIGKIRLEVKLDMSGQGVFSAAVAVKEKSSQKAVKNLRVSLMKDDIELESYVSTAEAVVFESVPYGASRIVVADIQEKMALVTLNISK